MSSALSVKLLSVMLCDPVLAFIKAFRLRGSSSNLKLAALSKFDSVVMCKAKKALWDSDCSSLLTVAGLSYQQRRGSEKRSQAAADLDDILVAFDKLDEIDKLPEIFCEAVDLVLLPPLVADSCTELVQRNSSVLEAIEHKLDSLSIEISNFSSKMGNIESCLAALPSHSSAFAPGNNVSPPPSSSFKPPTGPRLSNVLPDRRENLVVFGIRESRSLPETMDSVKSMLEFLTGRSTPVKDMFRIGRIKKPGGDEPTTSRPRPILLKLVSPWDRRLVLANRSNLKHYSVKGIFVREDLSPEARQQRRENLAARRSTSGSESLSFSKQVDLGLMTTSAEPTQK